MAFWSKFNFAPAQATSIDSILDKIPTWTSTASIVNLSTSSSSTGADPPRLPLQLSPTDRSTYHSTLDALLGHADLLTELKAGGNARLGEFISHPATVARLGGWIVWGLGRPRAEEAPNAGIIADDVADGKVPDFVVQESAPAKVGMGAVPRRRDVDPTGKLEGGTPETEQEKECAPFPRLATEILASESPSLTDALFVPRTSDEVVEGASHPARDFLQPFWESLLGSTELQLETRAVQVGYWARVNGVLLSGSKGSEALAHMLTIPHLLPRLLALLPFCSPLNDLLLLLLRVSRPPSPLIPSAVTQTLRMLDPFSALGKEGHCAAEELLRGIIELCSAAPANANAGPQGQAEIEWRDNTLARTIAEQRNVKLLVDWMVAADARVEDEDVELRTSSLVQSISVLVDLIRKNNSDFVEQHMLAWARRKEADANTRELLEADGAEAVDDLTPEQRAAADADRGPSLVDLGAMLKVVAERIPSFQKLIANPRSNHDPIETSAGLIEPLTLERFRICELYAELLHCSNMSLLNRSHQSKEALFDEEGYLKEGWKAADALAAALAGPPTQEQQEGEQAEGDEKLERDPFADEVETTDETAKEPKEDDEPLAAATESLDLNKDLPSADANEQAAGVQSPPGPVLKKHFLDSKVIETMLDLFFRFPSNNFLHNVVFDILQQIFNGRLDRDLDRQLALAVFIDGKLIDRILAGQVENDKIAVPGRSIRLGYMGHMILIAEEVIKLFDHYPTEIFEVVQPHIPQPQWDEYVSTTLRETRERDLSLLGGGVTLPPHDTISTHSALSDDDDEFPMQGARATRAMEANRSLESSAEAGSSDQFSRYLANAIASDRADKFGSSDEDDDEVEGGWEGVSPRMNFPQGVGSQAAAQSQGTPSFSFDDRFEESESSALGGSDDEEWGAFDAGANSAANAFGTDDFKPTVASSSAQGFDGFPSEGFSDNFESGFGDAFSPSGAQGPAEDEDEDDFGEFENATSPAGGGASITLPSLDGADDFDFDLHEHARQQPQSSTHLSASPTSSAFIPPTTGAGFGARPAFGRRITADDGSRMFGGLGFEEALPVPQSPPMLQSPSSRSKRLSMSPPASPARSVLTAEEPLGPGVSESAHLTEEGMVEREVDGKTVTVPADEIILAHRSSMDEAERPAIEEVLEGESEAGPVSPLDLHTQGEDKSELALEQPEAEAQAEVELPQVEEGTAEEVVKE